MITLVIKKHFTRTFIPYYIELYYNNSFHAV